ncbi:MAG: glycosyltransferase family 39 protein [Endomicrobiales bacterium]|nr:glycosyltransferase family 39 protein [Endomicrobiales bacterium]
MDNRKAQVITLLLFIAAHLALGMYAAGRLSPTYDEHIHLASGYTYLKLNDYRLNTSDHPPFSEMWAALPLLFMGPSVPVHHPYWEKARKHQYAFSDIFVYHNRVDPEKMLKAGRAMTLLLSLALGFLVFKWAKDLFGTRSGFLALALWCFMPVFLANGMLVTTDTAMTLFYFSTVYFLWLWTKSAKRKGSGYRRDAVLLGASLGLLFASKYSALAMLPVAAAILAAFYVEEKKVDPRFTVSLFIAAASAVIVLELVYRFNPLGPYFFYGLKRVLSGVASGRSSFLMGDHSTTGWWYYFPVVFFFKTPAGFLALLAASFFRKEMYRKEYALFLLLPALFYFAVSCFSKVQIGQRHIMLVYPFLIVWVSGLLAEGAGKAAKVFVAAMLVFFVVSAVKARPWYLSYCNEFVPSGRGHEYFTDSNLDWGQGLKELSRYLKDRNSGGIYMCYFGTGDPSYYGIRYRPIGFIDNISDTEARDLRRGDRIDFSRQADVLFAISATNLQATYYKDKGVFSFLKDVVPEAVVARSIFVYDLTKNKRAFLELTNLIKAVRGEQNGH